MTTKKRSPINLYLVLASAVLGFLVALMIPDQSPALCRSPSIPEVWFEQDSYVAPARSQLVDLSKSLGGSAVRMAFYRGLDGEGIYDGVSRSLVTEDIDENSSEVPIPRGSLPINVDDYYIAQLEAHLGEDNASCFEVDALTEIPDDSIAKRWAVVANIHHVFSCPIRNGFGDPVGYAALTFTQAELPTTAKSITARLSSAVRQISEDFQKR